MINRDAPLLQRCVMALTLIVMLGLQIQIDLFASATYIGLRINLGDLLLPFGGICILISLLTGSGSWPQFKIKYCAWWLVAITSVMTFAAVNFRLSEGYWNQWGLVNKYVGWLVLLSLFLWGAWARTNFNEAFINKCLKVMAISGVSIAGLSIAALFLTDHGLRFPAELFIYPMDGFMANRNSYALFFCCLAALISVFQLKNLPLIPPVALMGFWFLAPLAHALIGSRAAWVIFPFILIGLLFIGRKQAIKPILLPFIAGSILLAGLAHTGLVDLSRGAQMRLFNQLPQLMDDSDELDFRLQSTRLKYHQQSDAYRVQAAEDALEVWKSSPITGAGLGSFLQFQNVKYGQFLDVIDNSALWLLSETGLLGLGIFAAFYILIILRLKDKSGSPFSNTLSMVMIGMLLIFAAFSILHEVMYTRFIWFLMGLSLGAPALERIAANERFESSHIDTKTA